MTDLSNRTAIDPSEARGIGCVERMIVAYAGIAGANGTVADHDPEEFRRVMDVNVVGVFTSTASSSAA